VEGVGLNVSSKGEKIKTDIKIVDEDGYFHDDLFLAGNHVENACRSNSSPISFTGREI